MGLREVARYEERQRQVSINVGPGGVGSIVVGGVDIANMVTSATVELRGMQPTRVTLGMGAVHVVAETRGELDEQTAKALEALGWSGPDTELLRRRDLQEALGGLGTVLRDWDDLMEWVRLLVTHNGELAKEISSLSESDAVLAKVADALANNAPSEVKWSTVIERIGEMRDEIHELKTSEE